MSSTGTVRRLNWGCGPRGSPGWINSDIKEGDGIDVSEDIRNGLPIPSDSLDYVVSIHALPMIAYPDLVPVLSELRRMLKPNGVLRLALPDLDRGIHAYLNGNVSHFYVPDHDVSSLGGKFIVHMLWYGYSVSMFTADFIQELLGAAGFEDVRLCGFRSTYSQFADITDLDDREAESLFVEATKPPGSPHGPVTPIADRTNPQDAATPLDQLTGGLVSLPCRTRREFDQARSLPTLRHHRQLLGAMGKVHADAGSVTSGGYCLVCDQATTFRSVRSPEGGDSARATCPEFRCSRCGMGDHQRAMFWFTLQSVRPTGTAVYVAERDGGLSERLGARLGPSVIGRDRDGPAGSPAALGGGGNEGPRVPFPDEQFDLVVSVDVLGCGNDPKLAIEEMRRILKPGGQLLLTVPFAPDQEANVTRLRTTEGVPTSDGATISEQAPTPGSGRLPIAAFGWQLADDLHQSFPVVNVELYPSWQYGHIDPDSSFFRCIR